MQKNCIFKKTELQIKDIFDYVYRISNDIDTVKKYINGLLDKMEVLAK